MIERRMIDSKPDGAPINLKPTAISTSQVLRMQVLSKDMMIDTFYCDVGQSKRTSDMYKGIYDAIGGGFGTCNFQQGSAGSLKETKYKIKLPSYRIYYI